MTSARTQQHMRLAYFFIRIGLYCAFVIAAIGIFFVRPWAIVPLMIVDALIVWQLWGLRNK